MKYRAIIFDMDGTIVDTEHIWRKATKTLLEKRNLALSLQEIQSIERHLSGLGLPQSCLYLKDTLNLEDSLEDLIAQKAGIAHNLYHTGGVCFIDGFTEFHKKVLSFNLFTGLATNANNETLQITNKALNLAHYFGEHMYNISHVNNQGKPHPAIYLHTAAQLGIDPKECIAIEDSAHGIKAAQSAGMLCIGINTHGNQVQVAKADIIITTYEEISLERILF